MTTTSTTHEALERLGKAAGDIRAARAKLREEQDAAWQRYVATVEAALADDLTLPDATRDPDATGAPQDPVHLLIDALHGRVDDLRVQAQLGRMEAAELVDDLRQATAWVADHLKPL
jgi:hypothetical protein